MLSQKGEMLKLPLAVLNSEIFCRNVHQFARGPFAVVFAFMFNHWSIFFFSGVIFMLDVCYGKTVTADFPAGCHQGPGVGQGSDMKVMDGVCVFTIIDGNEELSGITIHSNQPGSTGTMTMILGLTRENNTIKRVAQNTDGWTHIQFQKGDVRVRFNPAPGRTTHDKSTKLSDGTLYLPDIGLVSYAEVSFPEGKEIVDKWWMVKGYAIGKTESQGSMMYHYADRVSKGDENSTLHYKIALTHLEIPGGWYYDCQFGIDLTYLAGGAWHDVEEMFIIAQGHMYDVKQYG